MPLTPPHCKELIVVRAVRADEGPQLRELRIEALTRHPVAFSGSPEQAAAEDWDLRARESDGSGLAAIFVAEASGTGSGDLAGMTGVLLSGHPKFPHSAFVWGVYVRPAWRGRRLGERLVTAACDWAAARGRTIVRLGVSTRNAAAIRAYGRCGFSVYGVERASVMIDGVEYDELLMDRRVRPAAGGA